MSVATEMPGASPEPADAGLDLVLPSRSVSAGNGVAWIGQGWKLFARSPLMWIISLVILFVIAIVFALIPFIGQLAFQLLSPVVSAGYVVACRAIERGGEFELEHLFAGFKRNFGSLVLVGLVVLVLGVALMLVFAVFFGFSLFGAFMAGDHEQAMAAMAASSAALLLGVLVCLAIFIPVMAAYWFAPALVVMHGMAPLAAMKESLIGCVRNILPMILWGLVMGVIMLIASIPFGLGLLVAVPVMIASSYAAYRAIFTHDRLADASAPEIAR